MAKRLGKQKQSSKTTSATQLQTGGVLTTTNWKLFLFQVLVIVGAGLWIYWPALKGDWLWDDDIMIVNNAIVHDPAGLWKIWFHPSEVTDYFFPIKDSVEWLEWHLWHNHTFGYHLLNVLLHICSALLVWRLFGKLGLRLAWLGGLLFIVHPVTVESVAWISELKNTLSLPPFLLAMCAFIDYENNGKRRDYFLALGFFLVAMLCKTTMLMFPLVILLYLWWKRGRVGLNALKISAPFFIISLGLGLVTVGFLHRAINQPGIPTGGFLTRLDQAGLSIAFYFSKCFGPMELLPIYPRWVVDPTFLVQFLPWPVMGGVIYWLWTKRAGWGRHALLGLGFFLLNIAPVAGFFGGSYMDFTWVMDHFLYIPLIGLIGLVVAALGDVEPQLSRSIRSIGTGVVMVIMGLLAWESHGYAGIYINAETLWTYTLQRNPEAWNARVNLGFALFQKGRISAAIDQYKQAIRLNPGYVLARYDLGIALQRANRVSEAIEQYEQAIKINPDYLEAHINLGGALFQTHRIPETIEQCRQVLRIAPNYVPGYDNLGAALFQNGQVSEAIKQYEQALKLNPEDGASHGNLGEALAQMNDFPGAIKQYMEALRINPQDADSHDKLGLIFAQLHRNSEATEQFEKALKIDPNLSEAQEKLKELQNADSLKN